MCVMFFGGGTSPKLLLACMIAMFLIGFVGGLFEYDRKMKKKAEEEERQAEQDRTNELMREYLEMKLREEKEDAE